MASGSNINTSKKEHPYRNGMFTSDDTFGLYNDPTIPKFSLIPNFSLHYGLLAEENHIDSALAYLSRVGETRRHDMLIKFIQLFKGLLSKGSWQIESVSGIGTFVQNLSRSPVFVDTKLTIQVIETVDWRVQALVGLWRSIVYDTHRKVEILPRNLQEFNFGIYFTDVRRLQPTTNGNNWNYLKNDVSKADIPLTDYQHRLFHFGKARFMEETGVSGLEEIVNGTPVVLETINWVIEPKIFHESGRFPAIVNDIILESRSFGIADNNSDAEFNSDLNIQKTVNVDAVYDNDRLPLINQIKSVASDTINFDIQSSRILNTATADGKSLVKNVVKNAIVDNFTLQNVYKFDALEAFRLIDRTNPLEIINTLNDFDSISETTENIPSVDELNQNIFGK